MIMKFEYICEDIILFLIKVIEFIISHFLINGKYIYNYNEISNVNGINKIEKF